MRIDLILIARFFLSGWCRRMSKQKKRFLMNMLLCLALIGTANPSLATVRGQAPAAPIVAEPVSPQERSVPAPLIDVPLRDPSITRGPDGTYCMTGTLSFKDEGEDFENNAGIRLWKSSDLKNWEDMGLVVDPEKTQIRWLRYPTASTDQLGDLRHDAGIIAPEIHYLKGTFWLAFSRGGFGTGLLKSESGKPEGPYVPPTGNKAMITHWGSDPSLFEDDDGSVYWLWAGPQVFIAKMKDDLSGLAEAPRALTCAESSNARIFKSSSTPVSDYIGRGGPFLYKVNGVYHLSAADYIMKHTTTVGTVFVAASRGDIYGPYSEKTVLIPHAGQTTVFQDNDGRWLATYGGEDRYSTFRDRPGIVPLEFLRGYRECYYPPELGVVGFDGGPMMVMNRCKVVTEKGPWAKIRPLIPETMTVTNGVKEVNLWDTNIIQAPDGWFYVTGSQNGHDYIRELRVWRSRDLRNWEDIVVHTFEDDPRLPASRHNLDLNSGDLGNCYMDAKISWLPKEETFAVSYTIYLITGGPKAAPHITGRDRGNFSGVIVSESGTIEGPWRWHDSAPHAAHYIQLEDGRIAVGGGVNGVYVLKPGYWESRDGAGGNSIFRQFTEIGYAANPPDTFAQFVEDSGTQLLRMGNQWVILPCSANGTQVGYPKEAHAYSTGFLTAESIEGPWSKWHPAVQYGGHAGMFQGLDGQWYGLAWMFRPLRVLYNHTPALVRLDVEFEDGRPVRIDIDPDWTVDDYVVPDWVK